MKCIRCRNDINKSDVFCPYCGERQISPKKKKKKSGDSNWFLILLILVLTILLAIMVIYAVKMYGPGIKNKEKDIGEIYYQEIDEEHIAEEGVISYADNEVLLVAEEDISFNQIEQVAQKYNASIVGYIEQTGDYQLCFEDKFTMAELDDITKKLAEESEVASADLNYIFEIDEQYNKKRAGFNYGKKWSKDLKDDGDAQGKSWAFEAINTPDAWDTLEAHHEDPVKVGLIDNGFDTDHKDLKNCFVETFFNDDVEDKNKDHGTAVAGIMAADSNNKDGICGVYPYGSGNLYGVSTTGTKATDKNLGLIKSSQFLKVAYAELILRGVKVINTSQGFNYSQWETTDLYASDNNSGITYMSNSGPIWDEQVEYVESRAGILGDYLDRLIDKGYDFVLVNSAGNDSERSNDIIYDTKYNFWTTAITREAYPRVYDRIIVVGAVDENYGISDFSNGGDRVDIYAPGENIYCCLNNNKYVDGKSGTSVATPYVSGVCAIVWTINNNLTGAQVKQIVLQNRNARCTSVKMVDAAAAADLAVSWEGEGDQEEAEYGSIQCFTVDQTNTDVPVQNATVTATNTDTGETETATSDKDGHFELILPEGSYNITATAPGYQNYTFTGDGSENSDVVTVRSEEVTYPDQWLKMKSVLQDYLENTLSTKYGLFETPQSGTMNNYEDHWLNCTGILGATIYNYDQDDMNEMLVTVAVPNGSDESAVKLFMYETEGENVVEKSVMEMKPYTVNPSDFWSTGTVGLSSNEAEDLTIGISTLSVNHTKRTDNDIYILCEIQSSMAAFADGFLKHLWAISYNGSSFVYDFSYSQTAGGSDDFQYTGYTFDDDGTLLNSHLLYADYPEDAPEDPIYTDENQALKGFFEPFDVKVADIEYDTSQMESYFRDNEGLIVNFFLKNLRTDGGYDSYNVPFRINVDRGDKSAIR